MKYFEELILAVFILMVFLIAVSLSYSFMSWKTSSEVRTDIEILEDKLENIDYIPVSKRKEQDVLDSMSLEEKIQYLESLEEED